MRDASCIKAQAVSVDRDGAERRAHRAKPHRASLSASGRCAARAGCIACNPISGLPSSDRRGFAWRLLAGNRFGGQEARCGISKNAIQLGGVVSKLSSSRKQPGAVLPQIQYMFACENATLDMAQNLNVSSMIERLTAAAFPTMTPRFFLVFGLQNVLPAVYRTEVRIEHSDGTRILDQAIPDTAVPSQFKRARIILGLQNFVWPKPGDYSVKLLLRGEVTGAFTLELLQGTVPGITIQQPPQPPPSLPSS